MDGNKEIHRYVILSIIPGFGVVSRNRLINMCGNIEDCFERTVGELVHMDQKDEKKSRIGEKKLTIFSELRNSQHIIDNALRIVEACQDRGISIVTFGDHLYPQRFRNLSDMPVVLYVRGELKINQFQHSVGIIGARRCSREGKKSTIMRTEIEVQKGSAIVSGMAKGVDSYAHTAAIQNDGYTVAVLGSGPDICYPMEHEKLYEQIIRHGCILSEYPPGTQPRSYMFPRRNRLIAAASDEVYVIVVGRRSGTETTVESCHRYGRTVRYQMVSATI